MSNKLPKRSEVPQNETWDLTAIFENEEAFLEARSEVREAAGLFAEKYEGKIKGSHDADWVIRSIREAEELQKKMLMVLAYSSLSYVVDMGNPALQKREQETSIAAAEMMAKISFYTGELSELEEEVLSEAKAKAPEYAVFIQDILDYKPHLLSPETEKVLASLGNSLQLPSEIYETMKAADMRFPDFEAGGETYPLSYVAYESHYCEHPDTEVRRKAFAAFSETLGRYRNTTAAAYNGQVQKEKTLASLRGFDSVFDYLLQPQKVTREMYDRQIDVIMEDLAPVMRRYAKLLQKEHGLEEMHYADLKLTFDPEFAPQVTIEESKQYISDACKIMGEAYHNRVMSSYDERWVDFARNEGKSTGGFCSGVPGAQPYILLNWNGALSEVFTLAHELGHAMQGILALEHNSYFQADMTRYDVEAPSTFHEMLLSESLLKQNKGPRFERWVLCSMISNTYYHNFVTHLLEAAYQREVYRLVDQGMSLQADTLDAIYLDVLKKFWGDAVILDEGAERTWMRQPHYYMGLYSYVYSASLTIATVMAQKLKKEGKAAAEAWMRYLSAGGPMPPAEHAAMVGIDITSDKPLKDSIRYIDEMLTRIEELSD